MLELLYFRPAPRSDETSGCSWIRLGHDCCCEDCCALAQSAA